jgi:tetratricopeptide (TPR) repeat protein
MSHPLRFGPIAALTLALLGGCAHQPEASPEPEAWIPPKAPLPIKEKPGMLGDLLVAEVAAQHDALQVALAYYSRVGKATNDPGVLAQATRLAAYLHEHQQALELAERWLRQAPANKRAREIAALASISLGEPQQAALHIDRLLARDPDTALNDLVKQARQLNTDTSEPLLEALSSLVEQYPEQAPLWYARALHRQKQDQPKQALEACDEALSISPEHRQALMLKGRLLAQTGQSEAARTHFAGLVERFPEVPRVRTQYARQLIDAGRIAEAREQVRILAERFPRSSQPRASVGLYALEQNEFKLARDTLAQLLDEGYRTNDMHLYLARVEKQSGHPDKAIEHYLAISGGNNRLRGRVQAARLMYKHGQPGEGAELLEQLRGQHPGEAPSLYASQAEILRQTERSPEAMELLNDAIAELPNERELLYARAMIAERLDETGQAEADLRRVLEMKPGDAVALNALGYTLADHDQRLDEAEGYIDRALEQQPDNPAFLDSKGWVLYRKGQLEASREWLRRAWQQFKDPEVAAHYGEVLWQLDEHDRAREVWQRGLDENPDNDDRIRETMQRLTGSSS